LKKNNFAKKKKKKGKVSSKKKKRERKNTVDYCCNPQCFVCGRTVNPPHGLEYLWGNSESPTRFRVFVNLKNKEIKYKN